MPHHWDTNSVFHASLALSLPKHKYYTAKVSRPIPEVHLIFMNGCGFPVKSVVAEQVLLHFKNSYWQASMLSRKKLVISKLLTPQIC